MTDGAVGPNRGDELGIGKPDLICQVIVGRAREDQGRAPDGGSTPINNFLQHQGPGARKQRAGSGPDNGPRGQSGPQDGRSEARLPVVPPNAHPSGVLLNLTARLGRGRRHHRSRAPPNGDLLCCDHGRHGREDLWQHVDGAGGAWRSRVYFLRWSGSLGYVPGGTGRLCVRDLAS
jgi:hypothetical protein